jgi:phenol 2-monooxygenase (NADPH)
MRLVDPLLQRGVRVYDISFWRSTADEPLRRLGREVHYPPVIDVLDPYILLVHQGMVESLFIEDMKKRGVEVKRNCAFESYSACDALMSKKVGAALQINTRVNVTQDKRTILAQYLVGCESGPRKPGPPEGTDPELTVSRRRRPLKSTEEHPRGAAGGHVAACCLGCAGRRTGNRLP